jgi:serine/threonine-protein kinase
MAETVRMEPGARGAAAPRARRCASCQQRFSGEARFCPYDGDPLVDAPDYDPAEDSLLGQTIDGRYQVEGIVGEGGMGTVYAVRHVTLGRRFAIKVLRRDIATDAEALTRFIQEAKAAAAIGHPNIVAVTDFGELPREGGAGAPYFVMEHLEGESLGAVLAREHVLAPARARRIAFECATALAAAHEAGVVHRDLKPDNVFLSRVGGREFVKVLDFGVAKIAGAGRLTRSGVVFGTPHYMSPEQASGAAVDHRTDVYALGVILYECFAGRVPFEADTYMGVLTKHLFAAPVPIEEVAPEAVRAHLGALGAIAMRCLAKSADDRYASMSELAKALERAGTDPRGAALAAIGDEAPRSERLVLREPNPVRVTRSTPPPIPGLSRSPLWGIVAAALVLVGIVAVVLARRSSHGAAPPTELATSAAVASPSAVPTTATGMTAATEPSAVASAEPADSALPTASARPVLAAPSRPVVSPHAGAAPHHDEPRHEEPPRRAGDRGEIVDPWGK